MTENRRDGWKRAFRSWWQGLAVAVVVAAWPTLSPIVSGDSTDPVNWHGVAHDLRLVAGVAAASYVQRTVIDPRRDKRQNKRVAGYLTADKVDREEIDGT